MATNHSIFIKCVRCRYLAICYPSGIVSAGVDPGMGGPRTGRPPYPHWP